MSKIEKNFSLLILVFLFLGMSLPAQAGFYGWLKHLFSNEKITITTSNTPGCIDGNAFEDYNSNGVGDTSEPGIKDIQVAIYNQNNTLVGATNTDNNGDWEICSLTDGETYRVEFIMPDSIAAWATPTHNGIDNGTEVQFVTAPNSANFGLSSPADFCEEDPELLVTCFVNGAYNAPALVNEVAIARLTYSNSADEDGNVNGTTAEANDPFTESVIYTPAKPTPTMVAAYSEVGTVWGMVKSETQNKLYSASYIKSGTSLGPGESTGAIYVTDNPDGTPTTTTYVDLNDVFGGNLAGVNPHPVATTDFYWPHDTTTNIHIGKVGLGDMDISLDDSLLYVVNLNNRRLYQIPTSGNLNSSTIQFFDIPTVGLPTVTDASGTPGTCPPADVRPFGTGVDKQGNVYVGAVCSCESISAGMDAQPNNASYQLTAYVWKFDGTNFTLVLDESLRFNRDPSWANTTYNTYDSHIEAPGEYHRDWEPWSDLTVAYGTQPDQNEPMLSDIEFDNDGNMLLGFRDRSGDIQAIYGGFTTSGDIYKACASGAGTWQFEDNGACGGTTTGGANNDQGPNGGEFYFEDIQGDGIANSGNGGLLSIAGKGQVVSSATDAVFKDSNGNNIFAPNAAGIQVYDNSNGTLVGTYNFYEADKSYSVIKASGIGDVEACCMAAPIEIGNYVWFDEFLNGIQDANETGVEGMIVQLYDAAGTLVGQDTTVNGNYYFNQYNVDLTGISVDGSGISTPNTAWSGVDYATQYFMVYGAGQFANNEITVASGNYTISPLFNVGANDHIDSDIDGNNLTSSSLGSIPNGLPFVDMTTTATGSGMHNFDLGITFPLTTIGNRVWMDENTDGIQDAGEPGIPGVTIELVNGVNAVIATTMTDANGGYLFKGVIPNTYTVRVASGIPTALDNPIYDEDNGTSSPDEATSVTVGAEGEYLTADFGYNYVSKADTDAPSSMTETGALGNRVWNDADGDGRQDAGEAGIPNISVNLYSDPENDGTFTNLVTSTTTDANGHYIFDNLAPDGYVVEIDETTVSGAGFVTTPTDDPDEDANNISDPIIIAPGDVWLGGDFGYNSVGDPADIGSTVFVDVDADGAYSVVNDIPLGGVTVALIDDTNGNGVWDNGEGVVATTKTAADGTYLFPDLPADTYVVQVTDVDNVLNNLTNNADPDGGNDHFSGVVLGATDALTENFGYVPAGHVAGQSFIGNLIYLDSDGNGGYTTGESGIEGVAVELLDGATNAVLATTVTNENGLYFFGNLAADDYKVKVVTTTVPSGLTNSVDPDGAAPGDDETNSFALPASTGDLTKDFGYTATIPYDISGTIWEDSDAEGILDGTETNRFENVSLALLEADGNIMATTTTDASGNYSFKSIPDGTYTVAVTDVMEVLSNQWHSLGTDSENDPVSVVVSGSDLTNIDFGYYSKPAALGNFVWDDINANGIQDDGEPGLSGVVVTLAIDYNNDSTPDVTVATVTGATGYYDFGNLLLDEDYNGDGTGTEPTYTLSAASPIGYMNTVIDANSNANDKEDADDPAGVVAAAIQGAGDVSTETDPNSETTPATFDFAFRTIPLPVTLTEFRARERGCEVELFWTTESEEDFAHFELEWSGNGQNFSTLERVKARGGNFSQYYQYKDRQAAAFNYYRLKMIDLDGSFEYSKVIQESIDCQYSSELTIYPNPVSPYDPVLNVKFYSKRSEAQIQITDMLGRVVKRMTLGVAQDLINTIQMDISDLPSGNYTMKVVGDRTSKIFTIQE